MKRVRLIQPWSDYDAGKTLEPPTWLANRLIEMGFARAVDDEPAAKGGDEVETASVEPDAEQAVKAKPKKKSGKKKSGKKKRKRGRPKKKAGEKKSGKKKRKRGRPKKKAEVKADE